MRKYNIIMKISKEIQNSICEEFSTTKTKELAKKYNIGITSVYNIIKKYNIPRPSIHKNRIYTLNESFFEEIDTEAKAYFLGFLYADGNVNPDNNTIKLAIQERDLYILERFNKEIESNRPITLTIRPEENWQNTSAFAVSSRKLFDDIQKKGCFINKTFTLKFPTEDQVPKDLIHHFIRGYFDGDGCMFIGKKLVSFSMIGTLNFLVGAQNILVKQCKLTITKIPPKHKTNNIVCTLRYGGTHYCERIREFLYRDATIYLTRKKEKFDLVKPKKKESKYHIL